MKTGTDFVHLQPFHFLEKLIKVNSVDCDPIHVNSTLVKHWRSVLGIGVNKTKSYKLDVSYTNCIK